MGQFSRAGAGQFWRAAKAVQAIDAYRKIFPPLAQAIDAGELVVEELDDQGNRETHLEVLRDRQVQTVAAARGYGFGVGGRS